VVESWKQFGGRAYAVEYTGASQADHVHKVCQVLRFV